DRGLTVLADVAMSLEDLDRAQFADAIAEMQAKLSEKEGSELDREIERLDHFKSIQHELSTTWLHIFIIHPAGACRCYRRMAQMVAPRSGTRRGGTARQLRRQVRAAPSAT